MEIKCFQNGDIIMQGAIAFDTYTYAKELLSAGFTEKQADVQVKTLAKIIDERLATKQDSLALKRDMKEMEVSLQKEMEKIRREIKEMEVSLKRDMKEMETTLKRDMKEMEGSLKRDMKEMELRLKHDLTFRLGLMAAAAITIVAALVKLL